MWSLDFVFGLLICWMGMRVILVSFALLLLCLFLVTYPYSVPYLYSLVSETYKLWLYFSISPFHRSNALVMRMCAWVVKYANAKSNAVGQMRSKQ